MLCLVIYIYIYAFFLHFLFVEFAETYFLMHRKTDNNDVHGLHACLSCIFHMTKMVLIVVQ